MSGAWQVEFLICCTFVGLYTEFVKSDVFSGVNCNQILSYANDVRMLIFIRKATMCN